MDSVQSQPRMKKLQSQNKMKPLSPFLVLPVKLNSGLSIFPFQQEMKTKKIQKRTE